MKLDYCPYISKERLGVIRADAERFFGSEAMNLARDYREKWKNRASKVVGWRKGRRGQPGTRTAMDYDELFTFAAKYRSTVSSATARLAGHLDKAMVARRSSERARSWIIAAIEEYAREKLHRENVEHYFAYALAMEEAGTGVPRFEDALSVVQSFHGRLPLPTYQARNALGLSAALESEKQKSRKRFPKGFEKLPSKCENLRRYFENANLTERQEQCASLRLEYGRPIADIARRLGLHRTTVQEYLARAEEKISRNDARLRNLARATKKPPQ
jgi:DNA-binding CsgD family transcriptional regulator